MSASGKKTVRQESLFILFYFSLQSLWSGRNYDLMLCFINVMKFCSGDAVRWKDNVQGVLKKVGYVRKAMYSVF